MHVLLVSTAFPFPANCGKARVLAGLCSFLDRHPRVSRVSYFHIARRPAADPGPLRERYLHAGGPGVGEVCRNLAGTLLAGRRPALQEALTFSRRTRRRLWTFIREERPDVVIVDTIRAAQYLERPDRPPARYLLYLDDLLSLRYERTLETLATSPDGVGNVLGNFMSFVPTTLRPFAARRGSLRLLLDHERRAVRRREQEVVRRFERTFLISPEEVEHLRGRCGARTIHSLKLLTENDAESALCDGRSPYFVFLGDLKLPHNRVAIEKLVRQGAGALERFLPNHRVIIAGRSAPAELVAACARTRNFELAGYVPDLRSLLLHARGLLAPLLFGSGVKIKCLEALRLGVPIIASRIGVEGLDLRPGLDYLHAADVPAVVRQMQRLTDDAEHARLVAAGHAWFATNYAPEVVWREYEHLLLAEETPRPAPRPRGVEVAA